MRKTSVMMTGALALALAAPGCVGKGKFRDFSDSQDARVTSVESAVEANERRIGDLKGETDRRLSEVGSQASEAKSASDRALSAAQQAEQAAQAARQGRLLWSVALTDDDVKFGFDKAGLSSEAMAALDELANRVKSMNKAVYLEIEGHTDNVGSETYNDDLGATRASKVMYYLNQKGGVPLHAMNTVSYGESQPIADNSTRAGRAQNRRVVIKVLE